MNEEPKPDILWISAVSALLVALALGCALAAARLIEFLIGDDGWLWFVLIIIPLLTFVATYWIERYTRDS